MSIMSLFVDAVFAAAAVSTIALVVARFRADGRQGRASRSAVAWSCVFALIAIALAILGPLGMIEGDPVSALILALVLVCCTAIAGNPERVRAAAALLKSKFTGSRQAKPASAVDGASPAATGSSRHAAISSFLHRPHPLLRLLLLSLAIAACTVLALELPSNHELWAMEPTSLALELALFWALVVAFLGLTRGHGVPAALVVGIFAGIGLAEHFVATFKAMPIQPGDLFALGTAATVAGGYQYVLTPYCLYALTFCVLGIAIASMARVLTVDELFCAGSEQGSEQPASGHAAAQVARATQEDQAVQAIRADRSVQTSSEDLDAPSCQANRAAQSAPAALASKPLSRRAALGAAAVGVAALAAQPFIDYYDGLGIRVGSWYPLRGYYKNGFLPAFISGAQKMVPAKPRGYKRDAADALLKKYAAAYTRDAKLGASPDRSAAAAQFSQLRPSVVCIMNESFADLSIFDKLRCGYQGPTRFLGIDDAVLQGVSYMSAYGAGTCNSEFEFLTGNSMAFLGGGVYPYMVYNLAPAENLARQFKDQGYRAVAMHPNHGTNWNRVNVFEDMGFDEFYTIDDVFKGAPELCRKVTDAATYDECLKVLRESDKPVFIHDVTMQNHSGYDTGLIPEDQRVNLVPPGADADHVAWTDEYLALMEESDRAFAAFLNELRGMDKPVVVVMYGDHQPFFSDAYNDAYFEGEGEADHAARIWQTRYVVWANYDVAGSAQKSEQVDTSINNVAALALQAIGAPLSTYQKAHLALMKKMPALSIAVRRDQDGSWHLPDEQSASSATEDDYARMQYRKLFDHGGSVFATRRQTAANETDPNAAPGADQ